MDENTEIGKFPTPAPNPLRGNHIVVHHGTELITYCHFRKNSIPTALKQKGAWSSRARCWAGPATRATPPTRTHTSW
jgi:hypothetical protein